MENQPSPLRPRITAVVIPTVFITGLLAAVAVTMMIFPPAFAKMFEAQPERVMPKLSEIVFNAGVGMAEHPVFVVLTVTVCGILLGFVFEKMRIRRVSSVKIVLMSLWSFFAFACLEVVIIFSLLLPLIWMIQESQRL